MNVIILNDFGAVNGGAAQVAITEALGLADRGHQVIFFYGTGPEDPRMQNHPRIQMVCAGDFDVLKEPKRIKAALKATWNHDAAGNLSNLLATFSAENTLVHLHGWHRSLSATIARPVKQKAIPLVCTIHDYFLACPNGGFYNFQTNQPCPLKALSPACLMEHCDPKLYVHKLWRYGRTVIQKHLAMLPYPTMAFISVSDFSRKIIEPYLPRESAIYDLPNPIAVEGAKKVDITQNRRYTYLGRLTVDKGPLLLAKANHDRKFKLTFIGAGPLKAGIETLAPTARFTGWLNRENLFAELANSRALIFPTLGYETQGMTVVEAASLGIPAIVSDSSAATSWVEDGVNGLWFRQGDADDLRQKMQLLEDNELLERLGKNAYEKFWREPHSPEQHVDGLIKIYQDVLETNNQP